ncbi:MAG: hypothetical protein AMS24_04170 [Chlamydiae bacterium SM23_39]|nr:MAG: hypothetical protein AMS24_04170 [Chlamydiae bacterium SM23_39]
MKKSERLKKLESELADLKQWLELDLVPKKEIKKHKEEIKIIEKKIKEEQSRLRILKETGEPEEVLSRKKIIGKQSFAESPTIAEVDIRRGAEETVELEPENIEEKEKGYKEEATVIEELEEDPFSDKNRWKRGILEDPDADIW